MNDDLHQSEDDPDMLLFYENRESGSDLDAHLSAPHLTQFAARIPELLDERGLTVNGSAGSPERGRRVPGRSVP